MADKVDGRRKRSKPTKLKFAIPLTEQELNAMREFHMRAESGAPDPGLEFLKHREKMAKKKPKRKLRNG